MQIGGGIDEDGEYEEYENSEGDTDEEVVDDDEEEANKDDEHNENDEANEKVKPSCKHCLKERFFDFIFEAEEFMSSDSNKQGLHYETSPPSARVAVMRFLLQQIAKQNFIERF